jgi:NTP pyrophosphatase (non-canonical NTP hydrolase)
MTKTKRDRSFREIVELTRRVNREFEKREQRSWGAEGGMIELTKQVGDLAKQMMVYEKYYIPGKQNEPGYEGTLKGIADELVDIINLVIRLADHYSIDLEKEIVEEKRKALGYLGKKVDF